MCDPTTVSSDRLRVFVISLSPLSALPTMQNPSYLTEQCQKVLHFGERFAGSEVSSLELVKHRNEVKVCEAKAILGNDNLALFIVSHLRQLGT